jgi:hypothetical protein
MGDYGVGLYLYFMYLKFMAIAFGIMSLIMIPALISNMRGDFYDDQNRSFLDFSMLGNQDGFQYGTTETKGIDAYKDNDIDRNLVIISDLINTVFFFLFILSFKYICAILERKSLVKTQTASDYTVYAIGIPDEGMTKKEILEHFSQYGKVIEVEFSRKMGKMMTAYRKQDDLNKRIYKQEIKVRILAEEQKVDLEEAVRTNRQLLELKMKDNDMEKQIREKYPYIKSYDDLPTVGAFITFDDVEACNNCFRDYRYSNRYTYQNRLKFEKTYKVVIIFLIF